MEEYIKKLLEQIRFEKAHKAIGDEIRAHIEDQIEKNMSDGMDKETAEKSAVEDMGNPVDAGIELDKVHRPQMAWEVVLATLVVAALGIVIRVFMESKGLLFFHYVHYAYNESYGLWDNILLFWELSEVAYFIKATIIGMALMLILYFIDYTTVAKYSKVMGGLLVMAFVLNRIIKFWLYDHNIFNVQIDYSYALMKSIDIIDALRPLIIPLFSGIIYRYKGQKYKGLIKAGFWIIITLVVQYSGSVEWSILIICMLTELTMAVMKGWIEVKKKPVLIAMWSSFIILFAHYIYRLKSPLSPIHTVADEVIRVYLKDAKLFGEGKIPVALGINIYSIALSMGIVIAIAVAAAIIGLIVVGLIAASKTKNQLGCVMAAGCLSWLAGNTVFSTLSGFGIMPDMYQASFLPFISGEITYDSLIASYAMFGIILSIYKYKNAYAEHVDISLRVRSKDFGG